MSFGHLCDPDSTLSISLSVKTPAELLYEGTVRVKGIRRCKYNWAHVEICLHLAAILAILEGVLIVQLVQSQHQNLNFIGSGVHQIQVNF